MYISCTVSESQRGARWPHERKKKQQKCPLQCPLWWIRRNKLPPRVPFQWRKRDKVPLRLPFQLRKHEEVPCGCPSSGEVPTLHSKYISIFQQCAALSTTDNQHVRIPFLIYVVKNNFVSLCWLRNTEHTCSQSASQSTEYHSTVHEGSIRGEKALFTLLFLHFQQDFGIQTSNLTVTCLDFFECVAH